jgi:hypothetical protein
MFPVSINHIPRGSTLEVYAAIQMSYSAWVETPWALSQVLGLYAESELGKGLVRDRPISMA